MKTYIYSTAVETARALIKHIISLMEAEPQKIFHIAFSGGSTPSLMFDLWADEFKDATPWLRMRIYWVDERCVSSENKDSNYRLAKIHLLDKIPLTSEQIFRIRGKRSIALFFDGVVAVTIGRAHTRV